MTTIVVDDAILMAYVDGELSPQQCEDVERQIDASPELAERVALLLSSDLPYAEAFERQAIAPVPESLKRSVDALVASQAAKAEAATHSASPAQAARSTATSTSSTLWARLFGRPRPGWLAVGFVTGAACYGLALQGGVLVGFAPGRDIAKEASVAAGPSPWVRQAASYQQLYSRDTLKDLTPDNAYMGRVVEDIRHVDGLALRVPDLTSAGLSLTRVQRLRFNDKALIQMVYLPRSGDPVALCVMKEVSPDQSIASMNVSGMDVMVWRQSGLGYALIGAPEGVDLAAIARSVEERTSAQLFAAQMPSPPWLAGTYP